MVLLNLLQSSKTPCLGVHHLVKVVQQPHKLKKKKTIKNRYNCSSGPRIFSSSKPPSLLSQTIDWDLPRIIHENGALGNAHGATWTTQNSLGHLDSQALGCNWQPSADTTRCSNPTYATTSCRASKLNKSAISKQQLVYTSGQYNKYNNNHNNIKAFCLNLPSRPHQMPFHIQFQGVAVG